VLRQARPFNVALAGLVTVAVVAVGFYVVATRAASGAATLSVVPSGAIVNNGTVFTVNVRENSGAATVNAVQANLTYPTAGLELVSIDASGSAFPLEAQSTGGSGSITLARATNGGQPPVSGDQLVATLTFKSLMTTGSAALTFVAGSAVVSSVDSTALTLTTVNGTYVPDTTAPTIPAGLQVTGKTGTSIATSWNAATDNLAVVAYNLYRDNVKIASPATTSFNDTGLVMGTTHTYAVTAVDAAGNESAKSSTVSATTPDTTAPSVPTGLSASPLAYDQVRLTWTASTDAGGSGLAGYKIYRNGGATSVGAAVTTTFTDTGLNGSTQYSYTITAYDGAGNESAKTTAVNATTPAQPDTTPPTTPTNFRTTATTLSSINLAWTASTDAVGVTGYQISRDGVVVASPTGTTFSDTGLTYGTTYAYTVKAKDAAGNLSAAATLSASTLPLKVGDINLDNQVNVFDLSILLSHWNMTGVSGDLNHDNQINIFDLSLLLSNWGK